MNNFAIKILALASYIAMVFVNFLANSLPINNRSTGAISDAYPNLFAPAGFAFAIWGIIYLLLAGYLAYQFFTFGKKAGKRNEILLNKVNFLFIATSIANISWIFAWHYDFIGLSVLIMAALLILLIKISDALKLNDLKSDEKLFISTPFAVYFGWITVAAIANITVFLVSIGWNGFGIADFIWTSIVLAVGAIIGVMRLLKDKKIEYALVLIWAYFGILSKHLSEGGFGGKYPIVIGTLAVCLALFGFFVYRIWAFKSPVSKQPR